MHLLAENWQQLLGIFWKFSLRCHKHLQIRSCIVFEKRYQSSYHINQETWIKGRSVSQINQYGGVDTQQIYQWYVNGRYCYIKWFIQRRGSIPILKDCYLPIRECIKRIADCSWWEWDAGSSLLFCNWPQQHQAWDREGQPHCAMDNFPQFLCPQNPAKTED